MAATRERSKQDPPRETIVSIINATTALADVLSDRRGRLINRGLPFVVNLTGLGVALAPLNRDKYRHPIWQGWPLYVPSLVADIAEVYGRLYAEYVTSAAEHNRNPAAPTRFVSGRVSRGDVQTLRRAVKRLRAIVGPTNGETKDKPASGKRKGTANNEASPKVDAALLDHHKYKPGRVGNWEPIERAALVKLTSKGYPTTYFKLHFGGWQQYKGCCLRNAPKLEQFLRELHDGQRFQGLGRTRDAAAYLADRDDMGDDSERDE